MKAALKPNIEMSEIENSAIGEVSAEYKASREKYNELVHQVSELRDGLKSDKDKAEMAFIILKSRYEHEKLRMEHTLLNMRNELRVLREEARFISCLLSARHEDQIQAANLVRIKAAENDKRILSQALVLLAKQKLNLTERFKKIEMEW